MNEFATLAKEIRQQLPTLELRENEPMSQHCSFKIGGQASALAMPSSVEEAATLCGILYRAGIKPLVIGNGTNLLITDKPLNRLVIKMSDKMSAVERRGESGLYALCGISLARLAVKSAHFALTGLEFAHGIPGTLGGATFMNAGAYGGEMKDVLVSATYLDEKMKLRESRNEELKLSYRHSMFSDTDCIVLGCELLLRQGSEEDILARMRELSEKRRASQPLDKPSAGSTFKRPAQGYAAALIDDCGLKGFGIGGAQVSEKHAGFVINRGDASFDDVMQLMEHVQKTVWERTGIELSPEVKIITNDCL